MKSGLLLSTVFVLCLVSFSYAGGIDGKWKGKVDTPQGELALTYTFIVNGDTLTGTVTSQMGELNLLGGKVNGDSFSFYIDMAGNTLNHEGKISGDKIILKTIEFPSEYELTRADKPAIDGGWLGKVSGPNGDMEILFTFKVHGDTLTGTNKSSMGEIPLQNGKINGDQFSFDVDLMGNLLTHKCKIIDEDSINVKADAMGNEIEMVLKRVKEK
jgi:hypothetical protein